MDRKIRKLFLDCFILSGRNIIGSSATLSVTSMVKARKASTTNVELPEYEKTDDGCIIYDADAIYHADKDDVTEYLEEGNVIAVVDNNIDYELLTKGVDLSTPEFAFNTSNLPNYLGCYIFSYEHTNYCVNVTAGTLYYDAEGDGSKMPSKINFDSTLLDKSIIGKQRVDYGHKNSQRLITSNTEYNPLKSSDKDVAIENDKGGQTIGIGFLQNLLYLEPQGKELLCSYTIKSEIIDLGTAETADGICEIYDCRSKYIIDAEPDYAVEDYSVRMKSSGNVIDASYLESNTQSTVSFTEGFEIGSDGIAKRNIRGGWSYSYNSNSQEITNNLKAGNEKEWSSKIVVEQYDVSWPLEPSIRALKSQDSTDIQFFSRVNELQIKDQGWWLFKKHYSRMPQYRTGLKVIVSKNGNLSQQIING